MVAKAKPETLQVGVNRSKSLERFLYLLHGLGLAVALTVCAHSWQLCFVPMLVTASWLFSRGPGNGDLPIRQIELDADGDWLLQTEQGRSEAACLRRSSFISPRLCVLNFRLTGGERRSVFLLADNCDVDQFRRLRVRLLEATAGFFC